MLQALAGSVLEVWIDLKHQKDNLPESKCNGSLTRGPAMTARGSAATMSDLKANIVYDGGILVVGGI